MGGRTETFNQRVVKVVAPTLEAKETWKEAAERDGFNGMSGWIRALIANHEADRISHLEEQAAEAQELRDRVRELEDELRVVRDAYEKAKQDLAKTQAKFDDLDMTEVEILELKQIRDGLRAFEHAFRDFIKQMNENPDGQITNQAAAQAALDLLGEHSGADG